MFFGGLAGAGGKRRYVLARNTDAEGKEKEVFIELDYSTGEYKIAQAKVRPPVLPLPAVRVREDVSLLPSGEAATGPVSGAMIV